jgi:hypothetical protein
MQCTVSINVVEQQFAGGTVGGQWRIEVSPADDPGSIAHEYEGPAPSANFDLPEGETFIIRGVRLDATDAVLGPVASTQYTVGEDLVPLDVADSISVAASPARRSGEARAARK